MNGRTHRILECLAAADQGLSARAITQVLGDEEGKGLQRNARALVNLQTSRLVQHGARGTPFVLTQAGRDELAQRQAGNLPNKGPGPRYTPHLSGEPIVKRSAAVDGQAPRGLITSPFAWGQMLSQGVRQ